MEKLFCIYFALAILNLVISLFLKVRTNILYCGLVGFAGWEKPDINKLKILFFANDSRGRDSCGYYYNKQLSHGVGTLNTSYKLLQKEIINNEDVDNYVFIGHTRQGSVGIASLENAHPFNIENRIIAAHNGTLENWKELCNKYEVDYSNVFVDSKALAMLIDKEGFHILSEYRGYAALLIHKIDEPNVLYVYHGASKKWNTGDILEERPMFFMETEEGVYFSSIKDALDAIRDDESQESKTLNHNCVFKFEYGQITDTILINRENNNIDIDKKTTYYQQNFLPAAQGAAAKDIDLTKKVNEILHPKDIGISDISENALNIFKEIAPKVAKNQHFERIIYYQNQYWIFNEGYLSLADGVVYADRQGFVYLAGGNGAHPYHFVKGYYFENAETAKRYLDEIESRTSPESNFAFVISKHTKYPVINKPDEGTELYVSIKNRFFHKGKLASTSIKPVFSDRTYVYKEGVLVKVTSETREEIFAKEGKMVNMFQDAVIHTLSKYLDKVWISRKELDADLPPEVRWAIKIYIQDVFEKSLINIKNDDDYTDELHRLTEQFITETVNSKFTIAESMEGKQEPLFYLEQAVKEMEEWEEADNEDEDEDEKKTSVIDKEIEEEKSVELIKDFCENQVPDLIKLADALSSLETSDVAQQNAYHIYRFIDNCKKDLDSADKKDLVKIINKFQA